MIAAAESVCAQAPETPDDTWVTAPVDPRPRRSRFRWPRPFFSQTPPLAPEAPFDPTDLEPEAVVRSNRDQPARTRSQLLQQQETAPAANVAQAVADETYHRDGARGSIDVTAFDGSPASATDRDARNRRHTRLPAGAAPPAAESTTASTRQGSIDVTAFDGTPSPTSAPPIEIAETLPRPPDDTRLSATQTGRTINATAVQRASERRIERPARSGVEPAGGLQAPGAGAVVAVPRQELHALPPLSIEPPFVDGLPPVVQTSYDVGSGESRQIARPMFNALLEDAGEPMPIVGANWQVPELDVSGAGRAFADSFSHGHEDCEECWDNPWKRLFCLGVHRTTPDIGIGQERVALAGFEIDASQPFNNVRLRYDSVYGLPFPDRSLWFWAKSGNGPPAAGEIVNYQDVRVYSEIGSKLASAIVEYPLRSLDPEINSNTTGFGDMTVGNKAVIVDGRYWQITQVFRTYVNTGSVKKGLGTGHVSLEPGVLARYKWTDDTYLHGQLKFWFPVGADPEFGGQIFTSGIGLTHLGHETDTFAVIHSGELVFYNFVGGRKTVFPGVSRSVDGEVAGTALYGPRFVLGPAGDLGLFEVGVNGGIGFGDDWMDGVFRLELRWSY